MKKTTIRRRNKWVPVMAALLVAIPVLSACSMSKQDDHERRTLRIGIPYGSKENEAWFRQTYTDMFELDHPDIDIEIVNAIDYSETQYDTPEEQRKNQQDPDKKMREIMSGDNPVDLILTDLGSMGLFAQDNLLKPLDPLIKQDKMDMSDFLPAIMDSIREQGDGKIYGLSPTFYSSALFYNKKLFEKAGISPPTDGMNWSDIFSLARSMKKGSGKDAVFGLDMNNYGAGLNYYDLQYNYAAPLKLRMFDSKGEKMTVNTPQWRNAWKGPLDLYAAHVIPHPEDLQQDQSANSSYMYNNYQSRSFFQGKTAMVLGNFYLVSDLENYNKNVDKMKGAQRIDWDVVTVPVHPGAEAGNGNIGLGNLASINAKAHNPDDAWTFVKHLNSEEVAKFKARSMSELSIRKKYVQPKEGSNYHIEAFTNVKPNAIASSDADTKLYRDMPNLNLISELGSYMFQDVVNGKKTVDEALKSWDEKGNELLQKIKLNPTGDMSNELNEYRSVEQGAMSSAVRAAAGE